MRGERTRSLLASGFLTALALTCASARAGDRPTVDPADEVQDVIFFHEDHPLFLRLHVRVNDRGFQTVWREALGKLYKDLDVDGDDILSERELNRGRWLNRMSSGNGANMLRFRFGTALVPSGTTVTPEVRGVSQFADLLRPFFGPLQIQSAPRRDDGAENLLKHLDRDNDQKLSGSELEAAGAALRAFDEDEDETIRADELKPFRNPFFGEPVRQPGPVDPASSPFALLAPGESRTRLVKRLLAQYDRGSPDDPKEKDRALSRAEIGLDEPAFRAADADGDGLLDADELVRFLGAVVPGLELDVRTGTAPGAKTTIRLSPPAGPSRALVAHAHPTPGDGLSLDLGTVHVEFNPGGGPSAQIDLRDFYKNQFAGADADGNKYIDEKESQRGVFNGSFALMDRDGDGKLTETEVLAFVEIQQAAAESRTVLYFADEGRSLFDALDANHDKRLSPRELRSARSAATAWDRNGDGRVVIDEVPRQFLVGFTRGRSPALIQIGVPFLLADGATPPLTDKGPRWFRKMDRNRDGDVSPLEFLGTRADFQRLDADGDGLIDAAEAAKAKAPSP